MRDHTRQKPSPARRDFLASGLGLAAAVSLTHRTADAQAGGPRSAPIGRRKLGALEVSALGLGCMSMTSGSYNPPRPVTDMIPVIRGPSTAASPSSTPPRSTGRSRMKRSSARRSRQSAARSSSRASSGSPSTATRRLAGAAVPSTSAGPWRELFAAFGPTGSTSCTSTASIRRFPSRT